MRQLVAVPSNLVVAACRAPEKATALAELKKTAKGTLHLVQLDVSDFANVRALPAKLEPILGVTGLDYLISNAGIVRPLTPSPSPFYHVNEDSRLTPRDRRSSTPRSRLTRTRS